MKYPNLDLSQLEIKENVKSIGDMFDFGVAEAEVLATKMAEITKKVVKGEIKTTIGLVEDIFS